MAIELERTVIPKRLYKYRAFDTSALNNIINGALYYSDPRRFNDPFDCDPSIEIDSDIATLQELCRAMLMRTLTKEDATRRIIEIRYNSTEYASESTPEEEEDYHKRLLAAEIQGELKEELGAKGVLSLSATWKSSLMWSHYGDQHQGICIEYDTTQLSHPNLKAVSYSSPRSIKTSDLVAWKLRASESAEQTVNETFFFAKSPQWKYEKEWRDLEPKSGISNGDFVISGIYFGMRCASSVVISLVKLLHNETRVELYELYSRDHSFGLHRRIVERDEILSRGISVPASLYFKDVFLSDEGDTK